MLATALTAAPAGATSIKQKQNEAAAAEKQLTKLSNEAEHAVEVYDGIHQKYENTLAALRLNQQTLRFAKQNLKAAQQQLAATLTQDYKSGDQNAIADVLAARSIGDLGDQVQVLQRTTGVNKNLLQQITKDQAEIVQREKLLKKQKSQITKQQAAAAAQRDRAKSAVARQMNYLDGLKVSIRKMIDEQQAAAAAAAAASATAAGSGTAPPSNLPNPPASTLGGQAVAIAERYLGVPYVWGGASPSGFDCSGLTMYVYAQLGIHLDHYTGSQWNAGPHVSMSQLMPGDLVFYAYDTADPRSIHHVAIYLGDGAKVEAPYTGAFVRITPVVGDGLMPFGVRP